MPKNIVLLSDGTGNSSGKLLKTNVWRIYEALDLDDPSEQVACYDDGVGTSSFKPLELVGGAFGVGLKKNVLRLYRFLCEHYDPGDRIYAFGFSRGAFTIRVLIGLIASEGIVRTRPTSPVVEAYPSGDPEAAAEAAADVARLRATIGKSLRTEPQVFGQELARRARWAYRAFRRREFDHTGRIVRLARNLRDVVLHWWERRLPRYDRAENHHVPEITFLGLWDTVDAYGLPIDELADGINHWVWPLSAPDLSLSPKVRKACHALAIDDERNTFHPVLWDESKEPQNTGHIDDERITQVWFAGMHANVGGGYPDDALSYISFRWMTLEAQKHGVHFVPRLLQFHNAKADPLGRIYDSRSGLKSYYRYNPRLIAKLTNGQVHESAFNGWPKVVPSVTIGRPKIHESVLARIAAAPEAYAPITFPDHYGIVREDGSIIAGPANPYESEGARRLRVTAQESVWNLVWCRRLLYFATVGVSLLLVLQPLGARITPPVNPAEYTVASRLIIGVGGLFGLPDPWVSYYASRSPELTMLVGAIVALMWSSTLIQRAIGGRMRLIWSHVIPPPGRNLERLAAPKDSLFRVRTHPWYEGGFAVMRREVLPNVVGIVTLLVLALLIGGVVNRLAYEIPNGLGLFCPRSADATPLAVGAPMTVTLNAGTFCSPTRLFLEEGAHYEIDIALPIDKSWRDANLRVSSPAGFASTSRALRFRDRLLFSAAAPFRRVWGVPWFVPIARVGQRWFDQYPLAARENEFTARRSGELFLFVNDAIAPIAVEPLRLGWSSYYGNNGGVAMITVTKVRDVDRTLD